jgi:hypothetical protein
MFCRSLGGVLLLAGSFYLWCAAAAQTPSGGDKAKPADPYVVCARACSDCQHACEQCVLHCSKLLSEGHKEHLKTLGYCLDCSAFCGLAARVTAHRGPLSRLACESCAKACDRCAAECDKHKEDAVMQQCARACRECAAACRQMLSQLEKKQTVNTRG